MLPEARRLRQRQELLVVQRRGSRRSTPSLVLHVAVGDRVRPARVGFIVPRAVGGAVVRNRVKRQLRHLVRSRLPGLAPGTELVVRARAAAAGRSSERLGRELDQALGRLAGSA